MIPVFLVNLDRRPDRLSEMKSQLDRFNIGFERIPAVDGVLVENSDVYFSKKRFFLENRQYLVPGEVGCALSHIRIWKRIERDDIDYALVLEDDVELSERILDFLESEVYRNFDYLKIDFKISEEDQKKLKVQSRKSIELTDGHKYKIFSHFNDGVFSAYECDPVPYYTGGYIISKKGAQSFLKISTGMYFAIDLLPRYADANVVEGFVTETLAFHKQADSDISGRKFGVEFTRVDRLLLYAHKIFSRRRLRNLFLYFKSLGIFK